MSEPEITESELGAWEGSASRDAELWEWRARRLIAEVRRLQVERDEARNLSRIYFEWVLEELPPGLEREIQSTIERTPWLLQVTEAESEPMENPFDALAEEALADHRAGRTQSLREFARERNITPLDQI